MKNLYNETLELSTLLVHVTVSYGRREEYQSLDELRDQLRKQMAQRDDIITQKVRAGKKGTPVVDPVRLCGTLTEPVLNLIHQSLFQSADQKLKQVNKAVNELQKLLGDVSISLISSYVVIGIHPSLCCM